MPGNWRKPSRSGSEGNCVEAASGGGAVLVRDTKDAGAGPVLAFTADAWRVFASSLR
jgi:hypothetical protein